MTHPIFLICAALLLSACEIHGTDDDDGGAVARPSERGDAELARELDALVDSAGVYGALAEARSGDRTIRARAGVADVERDTPIAWDSRFRIASFTKPFVAAVVHQLVGEGTLSLDDTVERWLPGVITGNGNDGRLITIRHLLQHTSGLYDVANDYVAGLAGARTEAELHALMFRRWRPAELVATALEHPPEFTPPGSRREYSNTGYLVLGMIIEAATGHPWADEVTHRIIEPLGLRQTSAPGANPFIAGTHPRGYEQLLGARRDVTELSPTAFGASAELISTPSDLNTFLRALLRGEVLAPAQLAAMKSGLGLEPLALSCGSAWTHSGDAPGFHVRTAVVDSGAASAAISITAEFGADLDAYTDPMLERLLCAHAD